MSVVHSSTVPADLERRGRIRIYGLVISFHDRKSTRPADRDILHLLGNFPLLRQKSQLRSLGVICNTILFVFDNKYLHFLSCLRTAHFCKHPLEFSLSVSRDLDHRFLSPLTLAFVTTSYTRGTMMRYCQQFLPLYAFLIASWVMAISNTWLNWMDVNVRNSEKVEMWISRFLQWKSKLSSMRTVWNVILFVFKNKYLRSISYSKTTHLCKSSLRLSSIGSHGWVHWFLASLTLMLIAISCAWRATPYPYQWYFFHSDSFLFRWLVGRTISLLSYVNAVTTIPSE
jgi:hypothetical protein